MFHLISLYIFWENMIINILVKNEKINFIHKFLSTRTESDKIVM